MYYLRKAGVGLVQNSISLRYVAYINRMCADVFSAAVSSGVATSV